MHRLRAASATALLAAIVVSGCAVSSGAPPSSARLLGASSHHAATTTPATTPATAPASAPTIGTTSTTAGTVPSAPWSVVSRDRAGVAVEERSFTAPSGRVVTLVRFDAGAVVFDLHVGSTDPPANPASVPPDRGPALAADERPFLLAAFNGGFKMNAGEGGVEVQGNVVAPLTQGMASFVIDTNGSAHLGGWGNGFPTPLEQVESVRQNQLPLITQGAAAATVGTPSAWGATVNASMVVARSAVGEDGRGDLIYAGGMALLPSDLAAALLDAGAFEAMQLDINPEWVQLDAAPNPGGPLVAQIPGQNRPAGQYESGWSRDFFAVMALAPATGPRPG